MSPRFDEAFRHQFEELLVWRRDVRRFRPDAVSDELLRRCVTLACVGPSVGNSQPWRFVRVADASRRGGVVASFERCNDAALRAYDGERLQRYARLKLEGLREAPVHLAIFCDEATTTGHGLGRGTMPEMLRYSVVTAVHGFWLIARAHGLGVGWVSILDPEIVAGLLEVPETWRLVAYLCVGYPVEEHVDPELDRHGWQGRMREPASLVER